MMSLDVTIRPMTSADTVFCAGLVGRCPFYAGYSMNPGDIMRGLSGGLSHGHTVKVAVKGPSLVGFAWVVPDGALYYSHLKILAADGAFAEEKVREQLLAAVESPTVSSGGLAVLVDAKNAEAKGFYTGHGYQDMGALRDGAKPGLQETIWVKRKR